MSARGVHLYGGGILAAFGLSLVSQGLGIAFGGAFLIWLGLTQVK